MTTARTRRRLARTACVVAAATAVGAAVPAAQARPPRGDTARVSEDPKGGQLDGDSYGIGLTSDGRSLLFSSTATGLVPGHTDAAEGLYVKDLRNGHVEQVDLADDGSRLDASVYDASISGDGRYVAFSTAADNVVPGQQKHAYDVFVRDRRTGRTELISAGTGSTADDQSIRRAVNPSLSWDGRYVAFASDRTDLGAAVRRGRTNIYVTDRWTGTTRLVTVGADGTPADQNSFTPSLSADGRTVGFTSRASNLLPPAQGPADTSTGTSAGPADDPADDATAAAPAPATGVRPRLAVPRFYPFYVWDARTGRISGASYDETGAFRASGQDGRISPDGRHAVYSVPQPGGRPGSHGIHLVVYVRELTTGTVTQVSTPLPGTTTDLSSTEGVMTYDSRWVYFTSDVETLVPDDTNQQTDVFRRDLWTGRTERVSLTQDGSQSTASSFTPLVDALGGTVVFDATDGNLVPGDTNNVTDVFRRRL
ncbi:PD40 domain-containing protein [Streptomyces sp. NRRL S-350]|uniref:PD40 domain-containing protein n=1 Tax=Streptomyces sp. NRRL S-350 TaxID=1463902 RepID=UPI0004C26AB5|nr:PD40 domain-containing protein [Streptomyces sp. NRRL S-350]